MMVLFVGSGSITSVGVVAAVSDAIFIMPLYGTVFDICKFTSDEYVDLK